MISLIPSNPRRERLPMEAELEILRGPHMNTLIPVRLGGTITIGRAAPSDVILAEDSSLSNLHFSLTLDNEGCWLTDLGSHDGILLNGNTVKKAFVANRSTIEAGSTVFLVFVTHEGAAVHKLPDAFHQGREPLAVPLIELLGTASEPLFALLDAARDPKILEILRTSGEHYLSLYEGPQSDELADWAPYLVALSARSSLAKILVSEGWGQSWGVFLTCSLPFAEVRKHFRRFLLVKSGRTAERSISASTTRGS